MASPRRCMSRVGPHYEIASEMRSLSAGMKAVMDSLRAADWDFIEKTPQLQKRRDRRNAHIARNDIVDSSSKAQN
jgi:hypothetical protein